jgi:hypothetical protein
MASLTEILLGQPAPEEPRLGAVASDLLNAGGPKPSRVDDSWKEPYMRLFGGSPDVFDSERAPYQGELKFFEKNPHVAGMATEDNRVILNPFSPLGPDEIAAVARNEFNRLHIQQNPDIQPSFTLTKEQELMLARQGYTNPVDKMATIGARLESGDPSAGAGTPEQLEFVRRLRESMRGGL